MSISYIQTTEIIQGKRLPLEHEIVVRNSIKNVRARDVLK